MATPPILRRLANGAELVSGTQCLRATRSATNNGYRLDVLVRSGRRWIPVLDGNYPLLSGAGLDLVPTECAITNTGLRLTGKHSQAGYPFEINVSARADTAFLHFSLSARLTEPLPLRTPLLHFGFRSKSASSTVSLSQGPDSIYRDAGGGAPYGIGFPAAYAWSAGVEVEVVFFCDITTAHWMSPESIARFLDTRVMSQERGGWLEIGLTTLRHSGATIPPGELRLDAYLYAGTRREKPTSLQALDTTVRLCAPLHPAEAELLAKNYREPGKLSWQYISERSLQDLMRPGITLETQEANWGDAPLSLAPSVVRITVHPAHPLPAGTNTPMGWDFSTVNNHLTPWMLYSRLHNDPKLLGVAQAKADALPCFFDPKAGMIRWGTRTPQHIGDLEMCWQNLFFHIETLRAARAAPTERYTPAIAGRFLMSVDSLVSLAHRTDYVFPQWFDPYTKTPVKQNDVPKLGIVREPWQAGSYAYILLGAFAITGQSSYRDEARRALERLFHRPGYTLINEAYQVTYHDLTEIPITELFGNAYGAVAAYKLFQQTRDTKYRTWSRDFLNSLLRLTFWYEDRTDAVSSALNRLGLFLPHGGATSATPWESVEAYLALAWLIENDTELPHRSLLLRLANCFRQSAFHFYPATFAPPVRVLDPALAETAMPYFPIEPFYSLEARGGHRSPQAAYMAGLGLWNYWMFEALATTDAPEILVWNTGTLDGYTDALQGEKRTFYLFNPQKESIRFKLIVPALPEGSYRVTLGKTRKDTLTADTLKRGIPITLPGSGELRVTLTKQGRDSKRILEAQNALAYAYALLQKQAGRSHTRTEERHSRFDDAVAAYRAERYAEATAAARRLIQETPQDL